MSHNNVINEKKQALLAYKEKILDEIKYYERSIEDFRTNHKTNSFYDDHADSSDSEDEFPNAMDMSPTITELKLQQSMMKICLHATQELTSLMVLQSEVDVLVDEPQFEGESPVTEAGTWREVTTECRIDVVPFTMTFFMHTPDRKFAPSSYRGLRVVPVKVAHELELSKSVLHSLKVPSDAVEILRSYAVGYRSRRTTLARLANKYTNELFMETHAEGGFILKCADLLEVSWRLENKWSPVSPFHHKMKFDLEYMDESYIKIITQAHKQLLDPTIQTDERTLLLAKIITTCLEARGPIDPESDLESKTTERDSDINQRDSDTEKRDSEVMAPPKTLPKKGKQKITDGVTNTAQKRSSNDENGNGGAKKTKNDASEAKKSITDNNNPRKSKMNDVINEGGKKRKISEVNKVASSKNVKEASVKDGNTKTQNIKETVKDNKTDNTNSKPKNIKDSENNAKSKNVKETNDKTKPKNIKETASTEDKNTNVKTKLTKESGDNATKEINAKLKTSKEPAKIDNNTKSKIKIVKENVKNQDNAGNKKLEEKNTKDFDNNVKNKDSTTKNKIVKESNTEKVKNNVTIPKNVTSKEAGFPEDINPNENNANTKTIEKKKPKTVVNVKSKDNIDANKLKKDAERPKSKITDKNVNKIDNKPKNTDSNQIKNADNTKNTNQAKTASEKNIINKVKPPEVTNQVTQKTDKEKTLNANVNKNVTSKEAGNLEDINLNENNANTKTIEKNKPKTVVNVKSKDNIDANKIKKDAERPKSKITDKNVNKIDHKPKNTDSNEIKNVANTKNTEQAKKASEKNIINKEKPQEVTNKGPEKIVKEKISNSNVKNDANIVKKVTEKNATNIKNKDKISPTTKVTEKSVKDKLAPMKNVAEKVLSGNLSTKKTDKINKNVIKKPTKIITHKIASHRNSLKPQNPPKTSKAGNTKIISTGNTGKENGGKGSKIPQKKLSPIIGGSFKKNLLRISPRQIPSKFKTSQEAYKQKMVKSTNIPRLLKKPAPKTTT